MDTSLSGESLNDKNSISEILPYDNDIAFLQNKTETNWNEPANKGFPSDSGFDASFTSSWKDLEQDYLRDKNQNQQQISKSEIWAPARSVESETNSIETCTDVDEEFMRECQALREKFAQHRRIESVVPTDGHSHSADCLNTNMCHTKTRRRAENEKQRKRDKEIASQFISPTAPTLSLDILEQIDLGVYIQLYFKKIYRCQIYLV